MDGLGALAHAAGETRRIELGIGVIPLHTRGPESIAEGVQAPGPAARTACSSAWAARTPSPRSACATGSPPSARRLSTRLIVAALGPKMCHLAGEVADGVLFNWLTPEHARRSADLVRAGAAAAKRPAAEDLRLRAARRGRGPPRRAAARRATATAAIPAYAANFERMGVKPVDTAIAAPDARHPCRPRSRRWRGAVDEVVLRAITAKDTVEENLVLLRAAKP